jgi:glycosyltransferase involved in cell wall biosynthesis
MIRALADSVDVIILGHLDAGLGVGHAARALLRAAEASGLAVRGISVGDPWTKQEGLRDYAVLLESGLTASVRVLAFNADHMLLMRQHPLVRSSRAPVTVGLWHWELEELPRLGRAASSVDEIWVASEFVRGAFRSRVEKPVSVMPLPIESSHSNNDRRSRQESLSGRFTVVTVFDYRSGFERKNPVALVSAFRRAFRPSDNAALIVKTTNASLFPGQHQQLMRACNAREDIVVVDGYWSGEEMEDLLAHADVVASLHRAEGFGLALAEAGRAGTAVMATAYGGPTDFLDERNAFLVPFTMERVGRSQWPYPPRAYWAKPDVDAAASILRVAWADRAECRRRGELLAQRIGEQYSLTVAGACFRERITGLMSWNEVTNPGRVAEKAVTRCSVTAGACSSYEMALRSSAWRSRVVASRVRRAIARRLRW